METFSALLALCEGNSPVIGEFPSQRPGARSFDVFLDLRLNKRLSKPSRRRWFDTSSRSLWRHCNVEKWIIGPCVLSLSISLLMTVRIFVLHLIITIKSEIWITLRLFRVRHGTMLCAVCLAMFLWNNPGWTTFYFNSDSLFVFYIFSNTNFHICAIVLFWLVSQWTILHCMISPAIQQGSFSTGVSPWYFPLV